MWLFIVLGALAALAVLTLYCCLIVAARCDREKERR